MKTAPSSDGAHFEAERGYRISKSESRTLRDLLPRLGFTATKKSSITDFVIPTTANTTRRMRIERVNSGDNAGVRCIKGFKNHPIKGKPGRDVRLEDEKEVKPAAALAFILKLMRKFKAPIPYYTKKRRHFQGEFEGYMLTITLDKAGKIGKFSGRYIEIETILPLDTPQDEVFKALAAISRLSQTLLGEERPTKLSYRKMLMLTWAKKNARAFKKKHKKRLRKVPGKKLKKAKGAYRKLLKKVSRM